jgi:hypothetical protein
MRTFPNYLFFYFWHWYEKRKYGNALANTNDLYRAEIRCFLCTTAEAVWHNPLCLVTIEPIVLDNFRE